MEGEGSVKEDMSDSEVDDLGSLDSEEINPSRLLDDLRGVYREHLMQIENVDEERDESYRVSFICRYIYIFFVKFDLPMVTIADLEMCFLALLFCAKSDQLSESQSNVIIFGFYISTCKSVVALSA